MNIERQSSPDMVPPDLIGAAIPVEEPKKTYKKRGPLSAVNLQKILDTRKSVAEQLLSTWRVLWPLALRNGTVKELEEVTDYHYSQVNNALKKRERKVKEIPEYFSEEWKAERRRRVNLRIGEAQKGTYPTPDQANTVAFAKALFKSELITENLEAWKLTKLISNKEKMNWFDNFSNAICKEAYVNARVAQIKCDNRPMELYTQLGQSVDIIWFNSASQNEDRNIARSAIESLSRSLS